MLIKGHLWERKEIDTCKRPFWVLGWLELIGKKCSVCSEIGLTRRTSQERSKRSKDSSQTYQLQIERSITRQVGKIELISMLGSWSVSLIYLIIFYIFNIEAIECRLLVVDQHRRSPSSKSLSKRKFFLLRILKEERVSAVHYKFSLWDSSFWRLSEDHTFPPNQKSK